MRRQKIQYKYYTNTKEKRMGGLAKVRRQRETLVVVEMSPCHIFHSQTAHHSTNTIIIEYKYNINPTLIQ